MCPKLMEDENCTYSECKEDSECMYKDQICCKTSCGTGKCVDPVDDQQLPYRK